MLRKLLLFSYYFLMWISFFGFLNLLPIFLQVFILVSVSASASPRVGIWLSNSFHAPCKRIQETLGFWIPLCGLRIPGTWFQSLSVESLFLNGIPYFLHCIPDSKAQDSGFRKQKFPGFWNPTFLNGATLLKQERLLNMFIVFEICRVPGPSCFRAKRLGVWWRWGWRR